jgi:hypothetical protein
MSIKSTILRNGGSDDFANYYSNYIKQAVTNMKNTREFAVEIACQFAKEKPESYYSEPFTPHEWVVDAIEYVLQQGIENDKPDTMYEEVFADDMTINIGAGSSQSYFYKLEEFTPTRLYLKKEK